MKKGSPLYVAVFMALVAAVCGAAVSFVHFSMKERVDKNALLVKSRSVARAFDIVVDEKAGALYDTALAAALMFDTLRSADANYEYFVSGNPSDSAVGFVFSGMGFWDRIDGILVLSGDFSIIRSLEIIDQKETPGLGARITEPAFLAQFKKYPVQWNNTTERLIAFGKKGDVPMINAITGATQTSMALERVLNKELARFRKEYEENRERNSSGTRTDRYGDRND